MQGLCLDCDKHSPSLKGETLFSPLKAAGCYYISQGQHIYRAHRMCYDTGRQDLSPH